MPVSTRSKRHKPEVNRKEEMADQSIFKNLLEEALGPITRELKLLGKAKLIYRGKTQSTRRDTRRKIRKEDQRTRRSDRRPKKQSCTSGRESDVLEQDVEQVGNQH